MSILSKIVYGIGWDEDKDSSTYLHVYGYEYDVFERESQADLEVLLTQAKAEAGAVIAREMAALQAAQVHNDSLTVESILQHLKEELDREASERLEHKQNSINYYKQQVAILEKELEERA